MSAKRSQQELSTATNANLEPGFGSFLAASKPIADFYELGPVLQADQLGNNSDETAITKVKRAMVEVERLTGWSE